MTGTGMLRISSDSLPTKERQIAITAAPWFQMPHFYQPTFNLNAILIIAPAALVVLAEHIGHLVVTGNVVERNLIKDPGLARSLFADGCSNVLSGFFGATPNTTYCNRPCFQQEP